MHWDKLFIFLVEISLTFTFDDLSYKKVATQSHTYKAPLTEAGYAVDRNPTTCMKPLEIGLNSPQKNVSWKVDLGGVYNIYSINIGFKMYDGYEDRQRGRVAGFSLYVSNSGVIQGSTLCYKDGPQLPPLNFTTTCSEHGRYVIFYNERKNGVNYPETYQLKGVFNELCEVIVLGCEKPGVFGNNCSSLCPANCKDNICHIKNGTCLGCKPGWTDLMCDKKCMEGWYGINCTNQCSGHCKDGITCNHLTSHCDGGCEKGWYGFNCSEQCVGHCRDGDYCNEVTGLCDGGCESGWTGNLCTKECNDGSYGLNCVNNCSGHCLNNSPCNKKTGHCDDGCNAGYTDGGCNEECPQGKYGLACRERCSGHCFNNEPCHHITGICLRGCQDGFVEAHCNKSCRNGHFGRNCSKECSSNCKPDTCLNTDGSCICTAGWTSDNCTMECSLSYGENCQYHCNKNCINQKCDKVNGSCLIGCKDGEQCDKDTSNDIKVSPPQSVNLPVTIGVTVATCGIVVIGIALAIIVKRLKRKSTEIAKRQSFILEANTLHTKTTKPEQSHFSSFRSQTASATDNADTTYALPEKTKRGPPTNKNIFVRNMKAQITNMSENENAGFKSEYRDIPRGELHPCTEAKKPENKVKNRYTTIFPYDHSRIILKPLDPGGCDYINANFIEDTRGRRLYIATQGPKPKTTADFWTMIWQEDVCSIVCLTNLTEGTKNKCAKYWPDINDKLEGGTLIIRHLEEKTYAEYIIRRFKIHNKTTRTDRHVTMFHYITWSDHGVADPLSLVVFHRHVIRSIANSAGKYTVVHCSAGVGRTGTYIALDALYREGERTGKINVPMYVRTMRKDRMNMIQGDDQYKLLYLALKESFYGQKKCLKTEKFLGDYQEQTCYANCGDKAEKNSYSSDLEELLSLRKEYSQQDFITGRAQISANYTESVLPVEEFMCHLYYMKGYNTYYNAVLIQSFLEKDSLISAQYPLPDTTEDFLRLVKDFDARVVVFLCPLEDIESGYNEMDITLFECPTWGKRQKHGDKRVLLDIIKAVKTEKSDQKGRVLVLSSDGATRCGPFFVVYNVLEQISVDREVDIFTAVRQIQIRRPECVSTVEEYKLCHDAITEYLLNDCVYGNC